MAFVKLGVRDGSNSLETATRLGTLRRASSRSFGGSFNDGESVEWFQFKTIGRRFNRSSLYFALSAESATAEVFFRPAAQPNQGPRQIGQLTVSSYTDVFGAQLRGDGTYFIKLTPLRTGFMTYGVGYTVSGLSNRRAASLRQASKQQLFF
jgi:hypothetical protein